MVSARTLTRAAVVALLTVAPAVWYACSDRAADSPAGPAVGTSPQRALPDLRVALAAQLRHTPALLDVPGVVGTAVGLEDGKPAVLVLLERPGVGGLPRTLDGVPVTLKVTGRIMALSDPKQRQRPAPTGYSVGHPQVTAGTIGARVRDALGRVYILSNNHVLAASNNAQLGDPAYQPGVFDGGTAADQIATLSDFQPITFTTSASNTVDGAIALSNVTVLDNATPSDDGYGMPNSTIFGDANGDGRFDDRNDLLGVAVQKYGRTTKLTHGTITAVNATVTVCYAVSGTVCTKPARFVDQLIISPSGFSNGGDSGSLIVTDDANLNPVGLLFAGSASVTIANRIDLVLERFGVVIDGFEPPPPGPFTDVSVLAINGPSAVVLGATADITVTVRNFGNQDVAAFDVTLRDSTAQTALGTQSVTGLTAGAATTLTFAWGPASLGDHDLVATHSLSDDRATNDRRVATVPVVPPVTDLAVTSVVAPDPVIEGHVVNVQVTVANLGNQGVDSFALTLHDATAGVTIGTQTVASLPAGATAVRNFGWDATGAALGLHTLSATHDRSDADPANDAGAIEVTVNPRPRDISVTALTAPARVTIGDVVPVAVTVQNVGEVNVDTTVTVVLTDATNGGAVVGTHALPGLALGASATFTIPWNTAGAATNTHILFATQKLPDAVKTNDSRAVAIIVQPPTDVAVTGVNAPAALTIGGTATITATVTNIGGQHVTSGFDIVVTDATAGTTIGTTFIPGMSLGSSVVRTFNWNTTGAALGNHSIVVAHTFQDSYPANNQSAVTVAVNPLSLDVGVSSISAPATVARGSTATVSVTVQNVGGQAVTGSFNIVLTDATAGTTIGTQAVTGLAGGASATRSFNWSTIGATAGAHTLVATQTLADAFAGNDQRSTTVTITTPPPDLSLTAITAPAQVTVGDTVPVAVTVQNVGGQDVTSSFTVILTEGGATVGTQTFPALAAGASATQTFSWNTAGVATGGHTLIATQQLPDASTSNNSRAVIVTVNPPSMHVGNLTGSAVNNGTAWTANVEVAVHDAKHAPLSGVTVSGTWSGINTTGTCVTGATGTCTVTTSLPITQSSVFYNVGGLALPGATYKSASNHDPDGSSNGFSIFIRRP